MWNGVPQFDIGRQTDIMDGCPKSVGLLMLLRGMNPQVLSADEITAPEDIEALELASNCGVALVCTAHAAGLEDLRRRPLYRRLLDRGIFGRVVTIRLEVFFYLRGTLTRTFKTEYQPPTSGQRKQ